MKALFEVISYDGDKDTIAYRHECEDFNTHSRLIVQQAQQAMFFYQGIPSNPYGPGEYILENKNVPIFRGIGELPYGGKSHYHCEVYFFNCAEIRNVTWGIPEPIQLNYSSTVDGKDFTFPIGVSFYGSTNIKVVNPALLIEKLIGTDSIYTKEQLIVDFEKIINAAIRDAVADVFDRLNVDIFAIDHSLKKINEVLASSVSTVFNIYGIDIINFIVSGANTQKDDIYQKALYFKNRGINVAFGIAEVEDNAAMGVASAKGQQQIALVDAETQKMLDIIKQDTNHRDALLKIEEEAARYRALGCSYSEAMKIAVAHAFASNPGTGSTATPMMGMFAGVGMGSEISNFAGSIAHEALSGTNMPSATQMNQQTNMENDISTLFGVDCGLGDVSKLNCDSTKYCDNCGAMIEADMYFCDSCGKPVELTSKQLCLNCGFEFNRPGNFCPKCGTKR